MRRPIRLTNAAFEYFLLFVAVDVRLFSLAVPFGLQWLQQHRRMQLDWRARFRSPAPLGAHVCSFSRHDSCQQSYPENDCVFWCVDKIKLNSHLNKEREIRCITTIDSR